MKFTKTVLKNGLRVITVPMQDNPAVTVLVMVEAGSKYETKEINGLSHFLEHVIFKGTPRRPKASDLSRELDSLGAQYNAFTSQEYTGYYAKVDPKHLDTALDIVSDMYQNPLFDEAEINKEKGVIIEEIKMYNDLPQQHVQDVLGELMFPDQPAGWSVTGPEENIRKFGREHFVAYKDQHYVAEATTVIVSGSIDEKEVTKKVEQIFKDIPRQPKAKKVAVQESQTKPELKVVYKETDQSHLVIGLRTFPILDPRIPTMRMLTTILGKGMSSRLFSKMRDELGICYYIRASHNPNTDHGDLTISAGVDNKRLEIAISTILSELNRLKEEIISEKELRKAKDYLAGTTMLDLETSDAQAEFAGFQEILKGKIRLPEEVITETEKVTAREIQKLAQEIFVDKNLNLAVIGPNKDEKKLKSLLTFKK
ncbi:MAG: pitrilysin family protein [Patescibacteria group bacterium]